MAIVCLRSALLKLLNSRCGNGNASAPRSPVEPSPRGALRLPAPLARAAERERQALRARGGLAGVARRGNRADLEIALPIGDALDALGQLDLVRPRLAGGDVVPPAAQLK